MSQIIAFLTSVAAAASIGSVASGANLSVFGDRDRIADGVGSTDDYATYSPPAAFDTWLAATGYPISLSDVFNNSQQRSYPFVLNQHAPFAVADQQAATVTFFIFHDPDFPNPATDMIHFWDETRTDGQSSLRFAFGSRLVALLQSMGDTREQTVEIEINLITGQAHAWRLLSTNGGRIADLGPLGAPWGQAAGDLGSPVAVLELARDGSLFGYVEDDMELFSGATFATKESPGCEGDIDRDGDVDLVDLAYLLRSFGTVCP